jgi:hypothetical protein
VARRGGGGGTASASAAVGSNVPRASRSAGAAFFARMDVRRRRWRGRRCYRAGGYESRCWTARLEGRRHRYGGRRRWMESSPAAGATAWMRRCRCPLRPTTETTKMTKTRARDDATRHNERGGGGDDKGQASGDDSPSRRDAAELEALWRCERSGDMSLSGKLDHVGRSKNQCHFFYEASFEQVFWRAEKNTRVI